ncbi:MAG: cyclase family protein [Candidatus Paceibacterota bacterium]
MRIIDISLSLNRETVIYPGNVPLSISIHHAIPEYETQLSSITFGSHTGTHIDAPMHAVLGGPALDKIPLENFVGLCRVLDLSTVIGGAITEEMLKEKNIKDGERILLKTKNSIRGLKQFHEDFVYLDGDAADYLASLQPLLVGIDSLSIKQRGGKDHRAHTSLLSKNIPILEGIDLKLADEKEYELFCLPLKFTDIDGAPARAVLIER